VFQTQTYSQVCVHEDDPLEERKRVRKRKWYANLPDIIEKQKKITRKYELKKNKVNIQDVITRSKPARSIISVDERNTGQFSSGLWEPDDPNALLEDYGPDLLLSPQINFLVACDSGNIRRIKDDITCAGELL